LPRQFGILPAQGVQTRSKFDWRERDAGPSLMQPQRIDEMVELLGQATDR
jgi:hypothetical protein